jgi:hypothetical protein
MTTRQLASTSLRAVSLPILALGLFAAFFATLGLVAMALDGPDPLIGGLLLRFGVSAISLFAAFWGLRWLSFRLR